MLAAGINIAILLFDLYFISLFNFNKLINKSRRRRAASPYKLRSELQYRGVAYSRSVYQQNVVRIDAIELRFYERFNVSVFVSVDVNFGVAYVDFLYPFADVINFGLLALGLQLLLKRQICIDI